MSEKAEIPVEQLQKVNLKKTETIEKQVLPSAEGTFQTFFWSLILQQKSH